MTSIEFPETDGLIAVLLYANKGLATTGYTRDGDGLTYDFHVDDGTVVHGTFHHDGYSGDEPTITIATHRNGSPDGGRVEVALRDITRVVYC